MKNALDEARILVLGTQVLLGFQFRAFFEKGWTELPPADRWAELGELAALLVTVGALFLPAARHRLVEHGNDSERFHRFTHWVMRLALAPFGIALALEGGIAGDRILGPWGGAACASTVAAGALALWYGHFARPGRKKPPPMEDTVKKTPLEHRIVQVLTETRVVLPGAQALLGFQLAMVLIGRFAEIPQSAKLVHLGSLGCVALATVVLMEPAAYHRIVERGEDSERFHSFAGRMILIALALLAPGFAGDLYVALVRADLPDAALPVSLATLLLFYGAWFGAMLLLRASDPTRKSGSTTPREPNRKRCDERRGQIARRI